MRLFVAVPTSQSIRAEAGRLLERLRKTGADFKWVDSGNLHWTLHFFGETEPAKLEEILTLTRAAAEGSKPFRLVMGGGGAFPSVQRPRVVWVGLREGEGEIKALAERLRGLLQKKGYPVETRPFHPHLTLGRMRSTRRMDGIKPVVESITAEESMMADSMAVIKSVLSPSGPRYEILESVRLGVG